MSAALVFLILLGLGGWQVVRLQWKLDLIARVEARVKAPVADAPGAQNWPGVSVAADEYRHVRVTGQFLYDRSVRVQAVTERGSGFWLLTPLRRVDGEVILINRGYVPARTGDWLPGAARPASGAIDLAGATTTVSGLLRISEPGGAFLRRNDPVANRWYSRDVAAIAAAGNLGTVGPVAPYFVDADAASSGRRTDDPSGEQPVGGLTVIAFHNSHLVYALTWFALALLLGGAVLWNLREERRSRRAGTLSGNALD
ncbi:SURF1 family protein [Actimicrobium sp. CCC2.4]|uniref:SURF1 family protein n=1 Tax=Actimicrobium sp. CCC2.4 TaxID=3048606 RepID=UPI002AC8D44E|nr:SURF1 family protein [Actimicrobium sp. CCC2.4]MEB0134112.1 SURF1 family protein [Actimicrobium sp. CCC2.4]WPX31641.1 SURF1 family protein [Actimicrobium sp. CCC2.4]